MKFFLVLLFTIKILFAEDLQSLLDDYELAASNEIAKKTKKESLGHLITYTQQDLNMMNAKVLKDILKTLPKISMQTNFLGSSNLTYAGNPNSISTSMRVYINDQEVSSVDTLSPWLLFADYPLDHISHIEFYYGESTVQLGNEPAKLTAKLYTKKPYTVSGGIVRSSYSTRDSNSQSFVYADEFKDSSLLVMLNSTKVNNPIYFMNNEAIKNNSNNQYGYFTFKKNNYNLSGGFSQIKKDDFLSLAFDATPDYSKTTREEKYIEISKNFNNSDGKIYLSYNQSDKDSLTKNEDGILLIPIIDLSNIPSTIPKYINADLTYKKYDFGISNKFNKNNHSLFLAAAIKHKESKVNHVNIIYLNDTINNNTNITRIKNETIYSILSEYSYYINDSNLLITNFKYDNYQKTGTVHSFDFITPRIGYISTLNKNVSIKFFATKTFTPPSMFELNFASKQYNDLNNEEKDIYTFETAYEDDKQNFSLFLNYLKIRDMIILDYYKAGYVNYDGNFIAKGFSLRYKRHINHNNKFDINYYSYINSAKTYGSPRTGGTFKAYQMYGDFSFYEEVIYKQGYEYSNKLKIKDSYNLSLGLKYQASKNLEFDFKANNILDDDMNVVHTNYADSSLFTIPNSTRSYTVSIKWTF